MRLGEFFERARFGGYGRADFTRATKAWLIWQHGLRRVSLAEFMAAGMPSVEQAIAPGSPLLSRIEALRDDAMREATHNNGVEFAIRFLKLNPDEADRLRAAARRARINHA